MSSEPNNPNPLAGIGKDSASNAETPRRVKTPAERVMPPVVYQLPGMADAVVHANLKYTDADNPFLLMDIYTPSNLSKDERRPVVICIHGGGSAEYRAKDWGIFRSWGRLLAATGFVGVTFTHRLGYPKPFFQEAAEDVRHAIDYVRAHAEEFNADGDRICLAAWSGGGPLLSLALREKPSSVRGLVAFYAFLDCQQVQAFIEYETPDTLKLFSPIAYLQGDTTSLIPMFVARAGRDEIPAMNDSIDRFVAAAIAANAPLTLMNHPSGEHGFDNQNDDERSREIIRAALAFLQTQSRLGGAV